MSVNGGRSSVTTRAPAPMPTVIGSWRSPRPRRAAAARRGSAPAAGGASRGRLARSRRGGAAGRRGRAAVRSAARWGASRLRDEDLGRVLLHVTQELVGLDDGEPEL